MKEWFKYFCSVFGQALHTVIKNVVGVVIIVSLLGIIILSFAGMGLCLQHLFTGEPLVSNWLYASPFVFILGMALLKTYLDW